MSDFAVQMVLCYKLVGQREQRPEEGTINAPIFSKVGTTCLPDLA